MVDRVPSAVSRARRVSSAQRPVRPRRRQKATITAQVMSQSQINPALLIDTPPSSNIMWLGETCRKTSK